MIKSFRDLKVYQLAFAVSLEIHEATLGFPRIEQFALGDQMRRASKSICANLAEGFEKQTASKPEFRRFIGIAAGSSTEMQVWIDYARALNYISGASAKEWLERYDHISRMLQRLRTH
jgi:four helix bundle protein